MSKKSVIQVIRLFVVFLALINSTDVRAVCNALVQVPGSPYTIGANTEAVAYSPDGRYLAVLSDSAQVQIYSVNSATGALTLSSSAPIAVSSAQIAYSSNGQFGAVTYDGGNQVQAYTVNSTTGVWTIGTATVIGAGQPFAVSYSPDSRFAAVTSFTNAAQGLEIYSVDQTTGTLTEIAHYTTGNDSMSVAYSPNGDFIAATSQAGASLFTVNSSTGLLTAVAGSPVTTTLNDPLGVAYSPNNQFAAVANQGGGGSVSVFSVNNAGLFLNTVPGSPYATGSDAQAVAYSPDGNFAAVGLISGAVILYGVNNVTGAFTQLATLSPGTDITSLAFSPNSLFLATANNGSNNVSVMRILTAANLALALTAAAIDIFGRVTAMGYGAQPGTTVTLYANCTTVIGTGTADSSGNFTIVASTLLPTKLYEITATQTVSSCTSNHSNQILVGGTMLSLFIQRVIDKYNSGC